MKVFITGATGFIGLPTIQGLIKRGHAVAALVRNRTAATGLAGWPAGVEMLEADLADGDKIAAFFREWRPETCVHLAWYAEPGEYLTSPRNVDILMQSLKLLEIAGASGCRKVVVLGTCAEYDGTGGRFDESSKIAPNSLYAASKASLRLTGTYIAEAKGMQLCWGRLFHLYGPREDARRIVPAAIAAALGGKVFAARDGTQVRDFLHVHDVASALCALAERGSGGAYNICSGSPVTVRELLDTIGALTGRRDLATYGDSSPRPWDPQVISGPNARLTSLGWTPEFSLKEGLAQTIGFWKEFSR